MGIHLNIVSLLFIIFLAAKFGVQWYLSRRNGNYIIKHRDKVPEKFAHKVSLEEHKKAADYSIVKSSFSRITMFINIILLCSWTIFGGLSWIDSFSQSLFQSWYLRAIFTLGAFSLIGLVLSLPLSLYSTFVIEEDFGFNKTTPKVFMLDMIKGLLLAAIIGLPVYLFLCYLITNSGGLWWVWGWLFITVFQLIIVWAYPRIIAPLFNKFEPLQDPILKSKVEELLKAAGFSHSGLFVMDASKRSAHGNAYFTGLGKSKRIVLFDTLTKQLSADELKAVLAHELGHFKHKHIIKSMGLSLILSFIGFAILGFMYEWPLFYEAFHIQTPSPYIALILFSTISGTFTFFMTPIMASLSRKNEFEADAFAAKYANAEDMINALLNLFKENANTLTPDPLFSKFYYSHPPASERIAALENF